MYCEEYFVISFFCILYYLHVWIIFKYSKLYWVIFVLTSMKFFVFIPLSVGNHNLHCLQLPFVHHHCTKICALLVPSSVIKLNNQLCINSEVTSFALFSYIICWFFWNIFSQLRITASDNTAVMKVTLTEEWFHRDWM